MKIVHEIGGFFHVGAQGKPYAKRVGHEKSEGLFMTEIMVTSVNEQHPIFPQETFYLQGDAAYILHLLEQIKQQILANAEIHMNESDLSPEWADMKEKERMLGVYQEKLEKSKGGEG